MAAQTITINYEGTTVGVRTQAAVQNGKWAAEFAASGMTIKDFVKFKMIEYVKGYVVQYEADTAQKTAYASALTTAQTDIVLT